LCFVEGSEILASDSSSSSLLADSSLISSISPPLSELGENFSSEEESDLLFLLPSLILIRLSTLLLPPPLTLDSPVCLGYLDVCSFDGLREEVRLRDLRRLAGGGAASSESEALGDEDGGGEAGRARREGTERAMLRAGWWC
jgi:hypothetical protein